MRLERIKLAGFKSFVDPTTVHVPSNLVGIVGPNGCGKSNVIDAVRWVMGESSAKMLRGESMADVIFNGSSTRKPVGSAVIELIFDNSDGAAGGEYAQYTQISVKRQVSRDGLSNYYLNNIRCRRRDITDLFLGTGLGPRSYSIIEQGMISRLIEAKPEELRVFLEEAAGISKYKERRRETENRIGHTRENLDRLNDLREEVAKQLQHLKRQAAAAERYTQLKQDERRLRAELLLLRWQLLNDDLGHQDRRIAALETSLEAARAHQRKLESEIEQSRDKHAEANDRFNEVQGRYYALGADVARLEQSIQYTKNVRKQQEKDLAQLEQAWDEAESHRTQDQTRLGSLNIELERDEPELLAIQTSAEEASRRLAEAEGNMHAWQSEWEGFNQEAVLPAQTAQVERARINQLEKQDETLRQRLRRLKEELGNIDDSDLKAEIAGHESVESERLRAAEAQKSGLEAAIKAITETRRANVDIERRLDELRSELQVSKGRKASLEALQQSALESDGKELAHWLEERHMSGAARLAQQLRVRERWQRAVEVVLGHHLQSVCVSDIGDLARNFAELESASVTILDRTRSHHPDSSGEDFLVSKVESEWPLEPLLAGIRVAPGLTEALSMRRTLKTGESVVTPEGVWIGANWVRLTGRASESTGTLAREQEISELTERIKALEAEEAALARKAEQGLDRLQEAETVRDQIQAQMDQTNRILSELRESLSANRTRVEHLDSRREALINEQQETLGQIANDEKDILESRARLHRALEQMESLAGRREELIVRRDSVRDRLNQAREESAERQRLLHKVALKIESMRSSRDEIQQGLERMAGQLVHMNTRREELQAGIQEAEAPLARQQKDLEARLSDRLAVDKELAGVRTELEAIDDQLRQLEQRRHQAEQQVQERHSELDQSRLAHQEVLVRSRTLEEQLTESGYSKEALLEELPEEADKSEWELKVERIAARIQRLGPINLAAIDEFEEQSERMRYLDEQYQDVSKSLETLENAIRKIDRETRTRFKETFDKVDAGLKRMFPKLFGGGHAYLELTGEDLLDTGVAVMARPPGKRNTSIHLLSGGEKALTAVALVFAIFELNPAPFCLLDEVDAPLDDANIGRFCDLVRTMSEQVQFVFITHNKLTMEIANQLTGVTMNEPGVSRLVSVDVEDAAELAAV